MCENLDFSRNFAKISILVEICEQISDFGRNIKKPRLWSIFLKNLEIFEKSWFWSKFLEISILVEIF